MGNRTMNELLDACVALVNLPYTSLLILVLVYWVTVILGLVDAETIDVHHDVDIHGGLEAGSDAGFSKDFHKDVGTSPGGIWGALRYFNVGEVPLMVIVSALSVSMWCISVCATHYLGITSLWIAVPMAVPIFIVSAFFAKIVTSPFRALYRTMEQDVFEEVSVVGRLCKIKTGTVNEQFGQAEVIREQEGSPLLINVRTRNGEILHKDDDGVVLEFLDGEDSYVITSLETE